MKHIAIVFLSIVSITAFSQSPSGKIVVKKGQHFAVESKSDGVITQEMMGQTMELTLSNTATIKAEIKDIKDNNYIITQTLTSIKTSFNGMGQDKSFDSDKKDGVDSAAAAVYKDKLNVPKEIVITNQGVDVTKADTTQDEKGDPMAAMMQMMGGGQENVAGVLFLVIPAGKKAGDTWSDSTESEGVKMKKTYTINSIANKEASVSIEGVLDINKTIQSQGMELATEMTSKISSSVLVDLVSGIQKENKSVTDVKGTIDVMGQSVPITSKITTLNTVKAL